MLPIQGALPKIKKIYTGFEQSFRIAQHERCVVDFSQDVFEVPNAPAILWELKWEEADPEKFMAFCEKLLEPLRNKTVGVVLDHAPADSHRPWREVLSWLPEEIPVFLHLENITLKNFPFELIDMLHLIGEFKHPYALPLLNDQLHFPASKRLKKAVLLPHNREINEGAIEERVIFEERLIYDWDGVEELTIFPEHLSPQGARMVKGFEAAGGIVKVFQGAEASPQPQES
ncbi:MAG: hypothetical protein H7A36_06970 [Chlamydiales bacterium]|nr:hypothetical protein [Chlamydiales bacterium]